MSKAQLTQLQNQVVKINENLNKVEALAEIKAGPIGEFRLFIDLHDKANNDKFEKLVSLLFQTCTAFDNYAYDLACAVDARARFIKAEQHPELKAGEERRSRLHLEKADGQKRELQEKLQLVSAEIDLLRNQEQGAERN